MTIYGPQKEGGQDKYDNLIENELERVNDDDNFRFYLRVSNKDRSIVIDLPGPILEDLPQKIKQRNIRNIRRRNVHANQNPNLNAYKYSSVFDSSIDNVANWFASSP